MVVVGTSLNVYPAASLLEYVPTTTPIYFVDPGMPELGIYRDRVEHIRDKATTGVPKLVDRLIEQYR